MYCIFNTVFFSSIYFILTYYILYFLYYTVSLSFRLCVIQLGQCSFLSPFLHFVLPSPYNYVVW